MFKIVIVLFCIEQLFNNCFNMGHYIWKGLEIKINMDSCVRFLPKKTNKQPTKQNLLFIFFKINTLILLEWKM